MFFVCLFVLCACLISSSMLSKFIHHYISFMNGILSYTTLYLYFSLLEGQCYFYFLAIGEILKWTLEITYLRLFNRFGCISRSRATGTWLHDYSVQLFLLFVCLFWQRVLCSVGQAGRKWKTLCNFVIMCLITEYHRVNRIMPNYWVP